MSAVERAEISLHSHDPADIVAEIDDRSLRVARLIASMRASWMSDALCAEFDLDLWFPRKGERSTLAYEICGRCTVREECLAEAIADDSLDHGIRGGMSSNARRVHRREQRSTARRAAAPPPAEAEGSIST